MEIPKKHRNSTSSQTNNGPGFHRYTPKSIACKSNPLLISGFPVFGNSDPTTTIQNSMERVIRESMECTCDPFAVHCVFQTGHLFGVTQKRHIVLPVENETVLESDTSKVNFIADLSPKCIDALYVDIFTSQAGSHRLIADADFVELEVTSSSNIDMKTGGDDIEGFHHTRVYRAPYGAEEGLRLSDSQCWDHNVLNNLVIYRPQSQYHYRLKTISRIHTVTEKEGMESEVILKLAFRHVRSYRTTGGGEEKLVKWDLHICHCWDIVVNDELSKLSIEELLESFTGSLINGNVGGETNNLFDRDVVEETKRQYVELSFGEPQLAKQYIRMTKCKENRFGYIIAMVLSNLRMIMDRFDSTPMEVDTTTDFYPNRFGGTSEAAQLHYDTRKLVRQKGSAVEALRRYNNLVKRILIANYIRRKSAVLDLACGHCQDMDKYATVGISHVLGIDISLAEIMEARRRFSDKNRGGRFRFKAEFHHGNVMEDKVYSAYVRNKKFDVVSMQLAIHYTISDESSAAMLLRNIHNSLCDKGIFIGSTVCCNAIAKGLSINGPYHSTEGKGGLRWEFGNSIFKVSMGPESIDKLTNGDLNQEETMKTLGSRLESSWGLKYHFFLTESIDAAEYVVPWKSFVELCSRLGFRLIETFTFPEYLERADTAFSRSGVPLDENVQENLRHHLNNMSSVNMSKDQQEAFMLYRVFVFEKVTSRDKMYMQGVKIRRAGCP
ncbi:hypothetical protein BgAZ_105430 [Babesia gibsoni]|uniref:mRNA (guanine-N(7))-methyltransferase n=1 Tax=Babesia gibsoni TaxID=33632 RepID=A0AAD8PG47_BABGI|nr:hypothetical protein BgAZ_105430 [Babesia gibsoni]